MGARRSLGVRASARGGAVEHARRRDGGFAGVHGRRAASQPVELDASHYENDARSIESAYYRAEAPEDPLKEAAGSGRDAVVPAGGGVGAADQRRRPCGRRFRSAAARGAGEELCDRCCALDGRAYAGQVEQGTDVSARGSALEFVEPLRLDGQAFALEVDSDASALERQLAAVRSAKWWVFGVAVVLAFGFFYVFGGRALSRRHRSAVKGATLDPLTELGNHRAFQEELARALSFAARQGGTCAVALVDLDDFKLANDAKGHRYGDEVLIEIGRVLRSGRSEDRAFRIGGDEFAIVFAGTDGAGAKTALERMLVAAQNGYAADELHGGCRVARTAARRRCGGGLGTGRRGAVRGQARRQRAGRRVRRRRRAAVGGDTGEGPLPALALGRAAARGRVPADPDAPRRPGLGL